DQAAVQLVELLPAGPLVLGGLGVGLLGPAYRRLVAQPLPLPGGLLPLLGLAPPLLDRAPPPLLGRAAATCPAAGALDAAAPSAVGGLRGGVGGAAGAGGPGGVRGG